MIHRHKKCDAQPNMPPDHSSSNSNSSNSDALIVMSKAAGQAEGAVPNTCSKTNATCLCLFSFWNPFLFPFGFLYLRISFFLCLEKFIVPPLTHEAERPQDTEMQLQLTAQRLLGLASSPL